MSVRLLNAVMGFDNSWFNTSESPGVKKMAWLEIECAGWLAGVEAFTLSWALVIRSARCQNRASISDVITGQWDNTGKIEGF